METIFNGKSALNKRLRVGSPTRVIGIKSHKPNLNWVNQPTSWGMNYHLNSKGMIISVLPITYLAQLGSLRVKDEEIIMTYDGDVPAELVEKGIQLILEYHGLEAKEPKKKRKEGNPNYSDTTQEEG